MADSDKKAKVEVKIGDISFSAEGDKEWLSEQLEKIIESASHKSQKSSAEQEHTSEQASDRERQTFTKSLASYIREKKGESNQNQRFLATAAWLKHKGHQPLTSALVTKALRENQQKRLGNPSDALNQNVRKGYCEKSVDGFFILPEGWQALGEIK
ncbi:MAG: hypothetical protein DHS20C08_15480 [Rhodomicrobium sp.]|nr:MAG: hypothetical protein DHS20C08_15480 [Rhodomicrobium sp.]